jgi:hypothetical protein
LERVKGIEPSPHNPQTADNQHTPTDGERAYTQLRAQIQGKDGRDLAEVVNAWAELPAAFKAAILAIVNTVADKGGPVKDETPGGEVKLVSCITHNFG